MIGRHSSGDLAASRRDDLRTLGLLPAASAEGILQAYLKLRRALRADSVALRSAASDEERRAMLKRVEEAYQRLCAQAGQPALPPAIARAVAERRPRGAAVPAPAPPRADERGDDPVLDLRSRPSPFRPRPSLPLR